MLNIGAQTIGSLIIAGLILASGVVAEADDSLGAVGPSHIPIPAPSIDNTKNLYVLEGRPYRIPRNYILSLEYIKPGVVGSISMRALWPDLTPRTEATAHCFSSYSESCYRDVIVIGLTGSIPTTVSQRLKNLEPLVHPEKKIGPCGIEYYEDRSRPEINGQGFDYFIKRLPNKLEVSILRCPKPGTSFAPLCHATENTGDGNSFYYVFDRSKLCDWPLIESKVLKLIVSFKSRSEEPNR